MFFQELSKILAIAGISASQGEFILTVYKNLSISPPPKEDLQVYFYSSCQSVEETKESCNTVDGEKLLEFEERIIKEDIQSDLNQERNQECHGLIERWFQSRIKSPYFLIALS